MWAIWIQFLNKISDAIWYTSFLEKLAYKLKDYNPHVVSFSDSIKIAYENNLIYVRKN